MLKGASRNIRQNNAGVMTDRLGPAGLGNLVPHRSPHQDPLQSGSHLRSSIRVLGRIHWAPGTVPGLEDAVDRRQVFPTTPARQGGLREAGYQRWSLSPHPLFSDTDGCPAGHPPQKQRWPSISGHLHLRAPRQEERSQRMRAGSSCPPWK